MTASRRGGPRTRKALGAAISRELVKLRVLAKELNGGGRLWALNRRDLMAAAADVIEATFGSEYPAIPNAAAQRFNALAAKLPLYYTANPEGEAEIASSSQGLVRLEAIVGPVHEVKEWRRRQAVHTVKGRGVQAQERRPLFYAPFGIDTSILLRMSTVQGWAVAWLADFLANPYRTRLRRCPICRRWFVDETRNRSAQRCSRKCTIAWSNALRKSKGREQA